VSERVLDLDWWYWRGVTALLAAGLLYWEPAYALLHLMCATRTVQLAITERSLNAFAVQVNVAFLALVVTTNLFAPIVLFAAALLCAGTRAVTGYCAISRLLALLPGNRREPLSFAMVKRTFCTRPMSGSILRRAGDHGDLARV
jgi:hypothetical protein